MRNLLFDSLRVVAAFAAILALGCGSARGADLSQFDAANRFYEAGKFEQAKAAYDQLIKSGPWSANLYYNRGNAEWRLGEGGEAVADYERALALEPSHPQAKANLDFVREQTGAKTATQPWWEWPLGLINANTASILLSASGWAALFCLATALLRPAGRTGPVLAFAGCLIIAGYAAGALWEAGAQSTRAIVIAKSTEARQAPADVAPIADVLPAGSEVLAPEERGPWTYCTLPDGSRAWVPTDALEKVKQG